MKLKQKNILASLFVLLFVALGTIFVVPHTAMAAPADDYCKKYTGNDVGACVAGYNRGAQNQSDCGFYGNSPVRAACTDGYNKAKSIANPNPGGTNTTADSRTKGYVDECLKQQGATQQQCQAEANTRLNTCADNQSDPNAPSIEDCMKTATAREKTKTDACKNAQDKSACEQAVGNCIANNSDTAKQKECIDKVPGADSSKVTNNGGAGSNTISADGGDCGGAKTVILSCNGQSGEQAIGSLLKQFVLLLSLGVGILATGAIIYGAILYSSARDSASQTQQAIGVIRNAVIGIILYIFMVAIVNWLVPGGVIT